MKKEVIYRLVVVRGSCQGHPVNTEKAFLRIKADRDVSVGLLISVIDEVRHSGVRDFSIVAERRQDKCKK